MSNQNIIRAWKQFKAFLGEKYPLYHLNVDDLAEKERFLLNDFSFLQDYRHTILHKGFSIGSRRKTIRVYLFEVSYRSGVVLPSPQSVQ